MTEEAPSGPYKVDITVAGHTIIVESPDPRWTRDTAWAMYRMTRPQAANIPFGYAMSSAHAERAGPYREEGASLAPWEEVAGDGEQSA